MTSINPINVNTQGVSGGYGFGLGSNSKADTEKTDDTQTTVSDNSQSSVAADDVLTYMAQSAAVSAPKTLDTSKYVDDESATRIAGFMNDFQDIVATNLSAITSEFPNMSESAAMSVALAQVGV